MNNTGTGKQWLGSTMSRTAYRFFQRPITARVSLQVAEAWEELGTPQWKTVLNECTALPDEFTVTHTELTAASEQYGL